MIEIIEVSISLFIFCFLVYETESKKLCCKSASLLIFFSNSDLSDVFSSVFSFCELNIIEPKLKPLNVSIKLLP